MNKFKLLKIVIVFIFSLFYSKLLFAENLYINSPELSHLEKIKNIKNKKKQKPRKDGVTYVGQKKLILQNGYGIMRFVDGGIFAGYFHNGTLRDGVWIIKGDVSYETYEYIEKNKPKKDSKGLPIINKSTFRPAKEFEIDYIKENVFLKNKITYEEYLKITGKDKFLAKKKEKKDQKKENEYAKIKSTGFNIFSGVFEDKTPYVIEAYYKDDCIQHGLVRYLTDDKKKSKQDVYGKFENCSVWDPDSKFANIFFDTKGVIEIALHKKDVSHIYGLNQMVGVQVKDLPNSKGVQIVSFLKDLPAIETDLRINDIIIKINGNEVENTTQFIQLIKENRPNERIIVDYVPNEKISKDFNYDRSNIKNLEIIPKLVKSKVELKLSYLVEKKEYVEFIYNHKTGESYNLPDQVILKKGTQEWKDRQELLKNDYKALENYYNLIKKSRSDQIPLFDFSQLYVVSNKSIRNKTNNIAKDEFKPDGLDDKDPPIIKVANNFIFKSSSYSIKGEVKDNKSDLIYIEVDGILSEAKNGTFEINRFSPVDEQIKIVAIDKWGNRSEPSIINVKIEKKKIALKKLDKLNPLVNKINENNNKVALIIGIENYQKNPNASFANLDAEFFYEYSKNVFGIKDENIKLLVNDQASLIDTLGALNKWLPGKIKKNKTELIVYFAGHGLASSDGEELYILPQDGDSDLLTRTGISRTELHETIIKYSPKNVTMFLDTCYSGVSRDQQTLLASARPVRIIANNKSTPKNFTIFSASQPDQISSGLKEVKHGIFSYFLMKGLEGKADLNNDNKITNGELIVYMDENVSQKAAELGRKQNPSLAGDPNKVLIKYR